jgi:hypothetical protein
MVPLNFATLDAIARYRQSVRDTAPCANPRSCHLSRKTTRKNGHFYRLYLGALGSALLFNFKNLALNPFGASQPRNWPRSGQERFCQYESLPAY